MEEYIQKRLIKNEFNLFPRKRRNINRLIKKINSVLRPILIETLVERLNE